MQCLFTSSYDQQAQSHEFAEIESIVREYSIENENIFSLVEFASCRNVYIPKISQEEESKEETKESLVNLIILFGTRPTK